MNYKTTTKYFNQKNTILFVGIGIAALGIIFVIIGRFMMYMGVACFAAAGAMVFISLETKIKGSEVNEECKKETQAFTETALEKYHLELDKADYISFYEYDYMNHEDEEMVKGNDGTYRPRHVLASVLFVSLGDMYVSQERFSLISEEDKTVKYYKIKLSDLEKITTEEYKIETEKDGVVGRYHTLEFISHSGKSVLKLPYPLDETIFEKTEEFNRIIRKENKG